MSPARCVVSQRTDLQMNIQGRPAEVTISKASPGLSSAAGSCLPSTPGSCQILDPVLARYKPATGPKEPPGFLERNKKKQSIVWPWPYGRGGVCECTHTHTYIHFSWKPVVVLCVINSSWWRETWLNEWHTPGSHVSLTHDVVKTFFCCDRLSLPFFNFCCRTCSCSGPQRSRTSFRIKSPRPSRL